MNPETVDKLRNDLKSQDCFARSTATWRLAKAGLMTFEQLLPLLEDDAGIVRLRAAEALAPVEESWAIRALIPLLGDTHELVRDFVWRELGAWCQEPVPAEYLSLLDDVRRAAIQSGRQLELPLAFVSEMDSLITRHYPEARCVDAWSGLHRGLVFEARIRCYPEVLWRELERPPEPRRNVFGPEEKGIYCGLSLSRGCYWAAAARYRPREAMDRGPFGELRMTPYSEAHDRTLTAVLWYAKDAAASFLRDYENLVSSFASYMD